MTYWQISSLVNAGAALIFGLFVIVKQLKNKTAQVFFVMNIAVFFWSLCYFFWQSSSSADKALFWCRALTVGSNFIGPTFFHYIVRMLDRWKEMKKLVFFSYGISICLLLFIDTPLVVNRVEPMLIFPFWPRAGALYAVYLLNFFAAPGFGFYLMWREYAVSSLIRKGQIKLVSLAALVGILSGSTNHPQWYGIHLYPIFNGTVWIYTALIFYAIVKYGYLEIETVIHKTVLWLLTSSLIVLPVGFMMYSMRNVLSHFSWLHMTFLVIVLVYVFVYYYRIVQPRIDHLFRRRKYDYYQVLGELGQRVGSELDITKVVERIFRELQSILYIKNGFIVVRTVGEESYHEIGSMGFRDSSGCEVKEAMCLESNSKISQWLAVEKKALAKQRVEEDSECHLVREEAREWFKENEIEILIPLLTEEKVIGILGIGKKENLKLYTEKDIELLEKLGRQMGVTIDNALHHGDIVEKERLAEEMRLGQEIQMNLLPKDAPAVEGLKVVGLMVPAKEIGGDYYDYITQMTDGSQKLGIVIGDVSGKGVSAGLVMAMAKTAVQAISEEARSPKEVLAKTNRILHQHINGEKFMTMLYLEWDSVDRRMRYSSAGHEHIIIYRSGKVIEAQQGEPASDKVVKQTENSTTASVEVIPSGGFMLGTLPEIEEMLEDKELQLNTGDRIVLYTDGVTEAHNFQDDMYGLERLTDSVRKHGEKSLEELITAVKDDIYTFIGTQSQYDDITLVGMEVR